MANRDYETLAKHWLELESSGTPLEPMEHRVGVDAVRAGGGLTIRNGRDSLRNEIRALNAGQVAYILSVFIRRDGPGETVVQDCWIAPPLGRSLLHVARGSDGRGKASRVVLVPRRY